MIDIFFENKKFFEKFIIYSKKIISPQSQQCFVRNHTKYRYRL